MRIFKNLSLSVYAFGYGCGFVKDNRKDASLYQSLSLLDIAELSKTFGLGGIEVPIDRYFPHPENGELREFIDRLKSMNLRLIFALENFSSEYFFHLAPIISDTNTSFVRVKVSDFYGGNRFCEPHYLRDKKNFINEINNCLSSIDKYGIKVLIENHQDITLRDFENFIETFGEERIGVNWDTGNTFPTGETTNGFLKKVGTHIGNVHLKDYRFAKTNKGYIMHRCALGKGVVDFGIIIPKLMQSTEGKIPLTIELGAMIGREAMINEDEYWVHTPGVSKKEIKELKDFVNSHLENENKIISSWQKGESPKSISTLEMEEIKDSINHIREIMILK